MEEMEERGKIKLKKNGEMLIVLAGCENKACLFKEIKKPRNCKVV